MSQGLHHKLCTFTPEAVPSHSSDESQVNVEPILCADPMNHPDYIHRRHQSVEDTLHRAEVGTAFTPPAATVAATHPPDEDGDAAD